MEWRICWPDCGVQNWWPECAVQNWWPDCGVQNWWPDCGVQNTPFPVVTHMTIVKETCIVHIIIVFLTSVRTRSDRYNIYKIIHYLINIVYLRTMQDWKWAEHSPKPGKGVLLAWLWSTEFLTGADTVWLKYINAAEHARALLRWWALSKTIVACAMHEVV